MGLPGGGSTFGGLGGGWGTQRTVRGAAKELEKTGGSAQDLIFELVRSKCDALLDVASIVWEPSALPESPRPETEDLISYLRVTFMCLAG